jgi:hypothetical protein
LTGELSQIALRNAAVFASQVAQTSVFVISAAFRAQGGISLAPITKATAMARRPSHL